MKKTLILLVHGLGGSSEKTWGKLPELIRGDNTLNNNIDVGFYSFPTGCIRFPLFQIYPKIQDLALGLRTEINNKYKDYCKIILIGHSLGGLICRKYLLEEVKAKNKLRVSGLMLYATPNNGAELASIVKSYLALLKWLFSIQIFQMSKKSDFIEFLNSDWFTLQLDKIIKIKYVIGGKDSLVDNLSAKSIWGNKNVEVLINKGHINIVKPINSEDLSFTVLKIFVNELLSDTSNGIIKHAKAHAKEQLAKQKKIRKYIPEVFTNRTDIKKLSRYFIDSIIFWKKLLEDLNSVDFSELEIYLNKQGLDYSFRLPKEIAISNDINAIRNMSSILKTYLSDNLNEITKLERLERKRTELSQNLSEEERYNFEWENNSFISLFYYQKVIESAIKKLEGIYSKIFVVTSQAGHGKTSFICDLVENVLFKRDIPCLLLTGSDFNNCDLTDIDSFIISKMSPTDWNLKLVDCLNEIESFCIINNKCFVLIIDGLNEHKNIRNFSNALYEFTNNFLKYPFIKLIYTCRSEYYNERFRNLDEAPFFESIFYYKDYDNKTSKMDKRNLLSSYERFFNFKIHNMSAEVFNTLTDDPLFLRIFSETYSRNVTESTYEIAELWDLYKDEVFDNYLKKKIAFLKESGYGDTPLNLKLKCLFKSILDKIVDYMIKNEVFSYIPIHKIDFNSDELEELDRIINEDILIRKDIDKTSTMANELVELISFTFDEFRDYLISVFMIDSLLEDTENSIEPLINKFLDSNYPISEGLAKYLFCISKRQSTPKLAAILIKNQFYDDLFYGMIFFINDRFVTSEDINKIKMLFKLDKAHALFIARRLFRKRHLSFFKNLNISLLLDIISELDESEYKNLILPIFRLRREREYYFDYESNFELNDFFKFLNDLLEEDSSVELNEVYKLYFEFVLLLMPLCIELDNEPSFIFKLLSRNHPKIAEEILLKYIFKIQDIYFINSFFILIHYLNSFKIPFSHLFYEKVIELCLPYSVTINSEKEYSYSMFLLTLNVEEAIISDEKRDEIIKKIQDYENAFSS